MLLTKIIGALSGHRTGVGLARKCDERDEFTRASGGVSGYTILRTVTSLVHQSCVGH